jgi:hypothetical protein
MPESRHLGGREADLKPDELERRIPMHGSDLRRMGSEELVQHLRPGRRHPLEVGTLVTTQLRRPSTVVVVGEEGDAHLLWRASKRSRTRIGREWSVNAQIHHT